MPVSGLRADDRSARTPGLSGQGADEPENDERVDAVEDPDPVHALADPREHDLQGDDHGHGQRPQNLGLPEPRGQCEQQDNHCAQEDQVAKANMEPKAVIEGFDKPVYYGVHGGIKKFYKVDPEEEHAATLDHIVGAVGG